MNEQLQPLKPIKPIQTLIKKEPESSIPADTAIDRLANELKEINERLNALEQRGTPATAQEVKALANQAKEAKITATFNSDEVAAILASLFDQKTSEVVTRIEKSVDQASNRITQSATYTAGSWAGKIGFTSPKAALTILGTLWLVTSGLIWYVTKQYAQLQTAQHTITDTQDRLNFYLKYDAWIDQHHPDIWKSYDKVLKGEPEPKKNKKKK